MPRRKKIPAHTLHMMEYAAREGIGGCADGNAESEAAGGSAVPWYHRATDFTAGPAGANR